jgi:uncharacterized double-CXXCG motif protein
MRFFELLPEPTQDTRIDASHRWDLPGVRCRECGETWGTVGIAYPAVDLSGLENAKDYEKPWPVDWARFEALRAEVLPLLPPEAFAPPGTHIGPLRGQVSGTPGDVAWLNPWTLLVRMEVLANLRAAGFRTHAGALAALEGGEVALIELQIEPHGRLSRRCLPMGAPEPCAMCGREALSRPERIVLDDSSLTGLGIFRLCDLNTMIIASEDALQTMRDLGLTGFRFAEVDVA